MASADWHALQAAGELVPRTPTSFFLKKKSANTGSPIERNA